MKTTQLNSTQPDAMDALALAVARAAAHCPPSLQKTLLEACDALEAEHDELKAERDALKVERHDFKFMFDDLYKEHKALKAERDALQDCFKAVEHISRYQRGQWEALDEKLSRVKASTVADQITNWAEANYSKSHAAQTVVEGCWDAGELEAEFDSLQAFIEYAEVRDDCREDIVSMGGE